MKSLISIILFVISTASVALDELAPYRAELATCYRHCIVEGMKTVDEVWREHDEIRDGYVVAGKTDLFFCMAVQELAFGLEACQSTCGDIAEHTLGDRSAGKDYRGRWRLQKLIRRVTAPLQEAGLWQGAHGSPTLADEGVEAWVDACALFDWNITRLKRDVYCQIQQIRGADADYSYNWPC